MWPFNRRTRQHSPTYTSESGVISIPLARSHRLEIDNFEATSCDFTARLYARRDIPPKLKQLIIYLFQRGAITQCKISFGSRMELTIAQCDSQGHHLTVGKRLQYFQTVFAEFAGVELAATWRESSPRGAAASGSVSFDSRALLNALGTLACNAADGL